MSAHKSFERLVESGRPVGEVIAVDSFLVKVKGMYPANLLALVVFEDGSKGFVRKIQGGVMDILHLGQKTLAAGQMCVIQHNELVTRVGSEMKGRVVGANGRPLDGKGPIAVEAVRPVFHEAPPLYTRQELKDQLETGVVAIDSVFPIVLGQRMALIGDSKSGKTAITTQIAAQQKASNRTTVYVMIAKRQTEVNELIARLEKAGSLDNTIIVVSSITDALPMTYLVPYVGCAIAEYFWRDKGEDVVIIYDDLTSHAMAYREISLLSEVSPGRDSYPGDMFFSHSSLLERAGRTADNSKTLTSISVVLAPGGDITAYLPTNIMSITDGQWVLDMDVFRDGQRPAISSGLSVTRVGGVGLNKRQKQISGQVVKSLAAFAESAEFSHFGSELAIEAQADIERGKLVKEILTQGANASFNTRAQQLMLQIIFDMAGTGAVLDINKLKEIVVQAAANLDDTNDEDFEAAKEALKKEVTLEIKK